MAPDSSSKLGIGLCSTPCTGNEIEACGGTALAVNTAADLTQLVTVYTAVPSPPIAVRGPDTNSTGPTRPDGSFMNG